MDRCLVPVTSLLQMLDFLCSENQSIKRSGSILSHEESMDGLLQTLGVSTEYRCMKLEIAR